MRKYYLVFLTSILITKGNCQNIINGDFEINNATDCLWNLSDMDYNNVMSSSWSFGNNAGSGIDIQKDTCAYANSPNNIWFVSLSKNDINGFWENDALSLEINTNLTIGTTYQISYYDFSSSSFSNFIIPVEIGLSTDSLDFGQLIHSSLPDSNTWTHRSFTFIAPNSGKYLTVQNEPSGTLRGWNFVDNFEINTPTGIDNSNLQSFTIYPNPFSYQLNISLITNEHSRIMLYDIASRKILEKEFINVVTLNTEALSKGIYIHEVRDKSGVIKKGKVVKE